jgi:DNA polymerase elongation subunit (family B)
MKEFRLFDFKISDKSDNGEVNYNDDSSVSINSDNYSKKFIIQLFGINEIGESVCIKIDDYKPFFYIKVDDNFDNSDKAILISEIKLQLAKTIVIGK